MTHFKNLFTILFFLSLALFSNQSFSNENLKSHPLTWTDSTLEKYIDSLDQLRPENISDNKWYSLKSTVQTVKLSPTPEGIGGSNSSYGRSVSVNGDRAIIGAPGMAGTGMVFVLDYDGTNWVESARLISTDINSDDSFGGSVSLSGNRALVGAPGSGFQGTNTNSGAAYIFDFDGASWNQTQKLTPSPSSNLIYYRFGGSVSLSGDRALVGAFYSGFDPFNTPGAAYVFDFDGATWNQSQRLTINDDLAFFGQAVSLSSDRALIGAPIQGTIGNRTGAAYIFDFDGVTWNETQKLTANDGVDNDSFGRNVSLLGDTALIGSYRDDDLGDSSGSAYIFNFDGVTWSQNQKLAADDGMAGDGFGYSVSLLGNRLAIGAVSFDNSSSGSAYYFDFDGMSWNQSQKLTADDGASGDSFGYSVSLSGNNLLIGSYFGDGLVANSGAAYAFNFDGVDWNQYQKLIANENGAGGGLFGWSVSLDGDRALIGASGDSTMGANAGSAYILDYDGTTWVLNQKLFPEDGTIDRHFGNSVSLFGNRALIGTHKEDAPGSAYIFDFDGVTWNQSQKLISDNAFTNDGFGYSLSLSNNRALIGASGEYALGNLGSAYIFDYDGMTWNQSHVLTASDGASGDAFGWSVSLSGDRVLIGAIGNPASAYIFDYDGMTWNQSQKLTGAGFGRSVSLSGDRVLIGTTYSSAYVFDYDGMTWNQSQELTASDGASGDQFGWTVSLSGNRVLIGAYSDDSVGYASGSAYIFDYDGFSWSQSHKLIASDGGRSDSFGYSVSLSNGRSLIGASGDDDNGGESGSAYVVDIFEILDDLIYRNGFEDGL